ncbi:uncharacterized protein MONOS_11280 [Monocercomonoides exilis]|uniref:uncharacterized protein n=1 Tax=Monocercomonoides exilis TaxID=2049356 RepID=UPI0035598AD0|nr:hypothetical protein MONOS_11280 [Monocercomonoides exilis]|eukprot:MONOS_11280.1-p1 / transcript=MONOS_11280.1 / gene=MONOS_11280 / organism=Monocercomonoides_exilis_PA203 / gene_product=unspecified product / transcript_product=unspecified product / location=Mono_scaffold00558:6568-7586(+) / protein_length=117 / sequence_SO=supercontig / SO=protein_coding / is_pseudo=false
MPPICSFEEDLECDTLAMNLPTRSNIFPWQPQSRFSPACTVGYTPAMRTFGSAAFNDNSAFMGSGNPCLKFPFGSYGGPIGFPGCSYFGSGYPYDTGSALAFSQINPFSNVPNLCT